MACGMNWLRSWHLWLSDSVFLGGGGCFGSHVTVGLYWEGANQRAQSNPHNAPDFLVMGLMLRMTPSSCLKVGVLFFPLYCSCRDLSSLPLSSLWGGKVLVERRHAGRSHPFHTHTQQQSHARAYAPDDDEAAVVLRAEAELDAGLHFRVVRQLRVVHPALWLGLGVELV